LIKLSSNLELITLANVLHLKELARIGRGTINRIVWSLDGKTIGVSGSLGVWLYDADNLNTEPRFLAYTFPVRAIAITPDVKTLAAGGGNRSLGAQKPHFVQLWDIETGKVRAELRGHIGGITSLDFSPDGSLLASGSLDNSVRLWDTETGMDRGTLWIEGFTTDVAFGPDGKLLATTNYNTWVNVWDVKTGKLVQRFEHYDRPWAVAFSPDGKTIASSSGVKRDIRLWDIGSGRQIGSPEHAVYVRPPNNFAMPVMTWDLAFSPDGTKLASAGSVATGQTEFDGLRVFDVKTQAAVSGFYAANTARSVAFSPDGKRLASSNTDKLILWDVETGEAISVLHEHNQPVHVIELSQSGELLACGVWHQIYILNLKTGKLQQTITIDETYNYWLRSLNFSPDGKTLLALAGGYVGLFLFDVITGERKANITEYHHIWSAAYSQDGLFIAIGVDDPKPVVGTSPPSESRYFVHLLNSETLQEFARFDAGARGASILAVSPDGKFVAAGAWVVSFNVVVWDVETNKQLFVFQDNYDSPHQLIFTHDNKRLISLGYHSVFMWDLSSGELVKRFVDDGPVKLTIEYPPTVKNRSESSLTPRKLLANIEHGVGTSGPSHTTDGSGETYTVYEAKNTPTVMGISNNDELLAIGYYDGAIQLWDVATGELRHEFHQHTARVTGLVFTPDDTMLISSSEDGTISYWGVGE
jgi:WD40 repeat protein